jgi:hypothetical protein
MQEPYTGRRVSFPVIRTSALYTSGKSQELNPLSCSRICGPFFFIALIFCAGIISGCVGISETSPLLVTYQRTGGIAGFSDNLAIYENGSVMVTENGVPGHCMLDDTSIEGLRMIFSQANFPALADNYPAPTPGADYFRYTITYQGKTVTTETTGAPPALEPVITILDGLVTRCGPRNDGGNHADALMLTGEL